MMALAIASNPYSVSKRSMFRRDSIVGDFVSFSRGFVW